MPRPIVLALLACAPLALGLCLPSKLGVAPARAADDATAKEAFDAAKELGTREAWQAFLKSYPKGFHADLARAYLKKLGGSDAATPKADAPGDSSIAIGDKGEATSKAKSPRAKPAATKTTGRAVAAAAEAGKPAIARGAKFFGFPEKFNRYYTDQDWRPSRTVYVSPTGKGSGATREDPAAPATAMAEATPGTEVYFLRGTYKGCFEVLGSGTYDEPIVLYGERGDDKSLDVKVQCCTSGRATCFNLENADYIAVDGFEMTGGKYGVRVVGAGYAATDHSRGIAVMHCDGKDQDRDPFFSGQSDWAVWEGNIASGAKKGDGHGIYLSNGGDWNIVRFNETFNNASSDFQINPDPTATCKEEGIAFDDPRCDAFAGEDGGGQGASDYFLIDGNYFHHSSVGPNFTSLRRSVVRNNIFGPQTRHNASFWQETDNPKLGASGNKIVHNLFITTERHAVKFENNSKDNEFANNVLLGIQVNDGEASGNPSALLMEVDESSAGNRFAGNMYISGTLTGRQPEPDESTTNEFSTDWFASFPRGVGHDPNAFAPTREAPFAGKGEVHADAPADRNGVKRSGEVDLGPIEGR